MISNAYCKKHDEIEPENHDFHNNGLWVCPQCSKAKKINIDDALKKVLAKYPELGYNNSRTGGNNGEKIR